MDCKKVGKLIFDLRKEKQMTQKQLADKMMLSDKTISKWERGLGCPDVTLLNELSEIFKVDIEKILAGDLEPNSRDGGNMKRIKFYVCSECSNILTATAGKEISCCGRKLAPLKAETEDNEHKLTVKPYDGENYIKLNHPMEKDHYISFLAYVRFDRVLLVKLYPEQADEVCIPAMPKGTLYYYCSEHGLKKRTFN